MILAAQKMRRSLNSRLAARSRRTRWVGGLAIVLGLTFWTGAADAQALSLETAIRGALRNDNIALQMQNETVNGAAAKVKQAAGQFDWNATAQGGWQLLYVGKTTPNGILTNSVTAVSSYYYSAGIGREFRNGISIAPGFIGYAGVSAALTGGLTQTRPVLGLKIPLMRGLGEESADAAERAAKDAFMGSKLGRNFAIAQLVENVTQTYWRCVADDQILQITHTADKAAQDYQAAVEKLVKRGLMEPQMAKQNAINNLAPHLNVATVEQTTRQCHRDLAYATTGSINEPWPTVADSMPRIETMSDAVKSLNKSALIQLAYENRPDLQAAQKNVEASAEMLRSAHDNTLPDLSLHIDPDHATVSYTQSLENNAAEGQEEAAKAANNQALLALRQLRDQIRVDVTDAIYNVQQAAASWSALNDAEHQLEPIVDSNKKKAQFGAISWEAYGSSQSQLWGLQQQVVNAQLQFAIGLAALRLATGSIEMDSETPGNIALKLASLPAR